MFFKVQLGGTWHKLMWPFVASPSKSPQRCSIPSVTAALRQSRGRTAPRALCWYRLSCCGLSPCTERSSVVQQAPNRAGPILPMLPPSPSPLAGRRMRWGRSITVLRKWCIEAAHRHRQLSLFAHKMTHSSSWGALHVLHRNLNQFSQNLC